MAQWQNSKRGKKVDLAYVAALDKESNTVAPCGPLQGRDSPISDRRSELRSNIRTAPNR